MRRLVPTLFVLSLAACASNEKKDAQTPADQASTPNQPAPADADRSRCDATGKKVVEIDLNQDKKADVWKIYVAQLENGAKVDVLSCKEVDLNFDGRKDMWVYYDNGGNVTLEEFDLDFDGRLDMWTYRQSGRMVRQELDTNFDTKPDIWKFFENEKLARIERSSKRNGRVDVWEYYEGGKLDRIGYDTVGNGQVTRWDRAVDEAPAGGGVPQPEGDKPAPPPRSTPPTVTPETGGAR